jgi:iron(III) transport system permease protein
MSSTRQVPKSLLVPAVVSAVFSVIPLWYLLDTAFGSGFNAVVDEIFRESTLNLVIRSVLLTACVTVASAIVGTFAGWVLALSGIRPRGLLLVMLSLSLAIPSYLSAFAWISWLPWLNGFWGAFIVLTLVSYPFVMLPVVASLHAADPVQEEIARSLGRSDLSVFLSVTLGQARTAIAGGSLLVALYVLSDFGAVAAMRFEAFTWVIYGSYRAGFNPARAAVLSLVLVALAMIVTFFESRVRGRAGAQRIGSGVSRMRNVKPKTHHQIVAWVFSIIVVSGGVGVPLISVITWMFRQSQTKIDGWAVFRSIVSSFQIGTFTAIATVLIALPVALAAARYSGRFVKFLEQATFASHALPGIVIAIAMVFFGLHTMRAWYQEIPLLVLAQTVIFIPLAVASMRSSIERSTAAVEDVARSLGANPVATAIRVTLPIALPGVLAAVALTLLSSVKELPATLLLRPTGTETLATSIWKYSTVSDFAAVAPFGLALILLSAVPVAVMTATMNVARAE